MEEMEKNELTTEDIRVEPEVEAEPEVAVEPKKIEQTLQLFCKGSGSNNPEDALPIVETYFLQVADGLGGSGGFSHAQLCPEAMQKDSFFDTVFAGAFPELNNVDRARVKAYAEASLEKYFALDTEQKTDRRCIYTSGYFASRLVSTLMYGYLSEMGEACICEMIEKVAGADEGKQELCKKIGEHFTEKVYSGLSEAAKQGNFFKETKNVTTSVLVLAN